MGMPSAMADVEPMPRRYMYASALTGSKFGGYMGQCLAWPTSRFAAVKVIANTT